MGVKDHEEFLKNPLLKEEFDNLWPAGKYFRMNKKIGIWAIFSFLFRPENFFKNDPIQANFMRGIDCAHFRSLKTFS